jgi:hypothetical protein
MGTRGSSARIMANNKKQADGIWKERKARYQEQNQSKIDSDELTTKSERVRTLFDNDRLRDWVFAPFRAIFHTDGDVTVSDVRKTITGVALANAALAGLPGKLGVGVAVTMALEAFMALRIAQHLGITQVKTPQDTLKLFGALGGTAVVVLWLFRQLLGLAFSLFSLVGALPATFLAELAVTNFVGVLLWAGFREMTSSKAFRVPARTAGFVAGQTQYLLNHQWSVLKGVVSPSNLAVVGKRLMAWISGDVVLKPAVIRDEIFVAAAMVTLVRKNAGGLQGPISSLFLRSIRDLYPDLAGEDIDGLAEHFSQYDEAQMEGVFNQIKGRLHERMVEASENADGDAWTSQLHDDPFHRSTDIIFSNTDSGESFEVSLKATDNPAYVEHALSRYASDPVMTTEEVAEMFDGDGRVTSSGITNSELESVTQESFDDLLEDLEPIGGDIAAGAVLGGGMGAIARLWPFVAAWMRKRITNTQLETAFIRVLGDSGARLVPRLAASIILGPIYMWYAFARGVMSISELAHGGEQDKV